MILIIDNYDSFTYNLSQYLGQLGREVFIRRNDEITLDEIDRLDPERIIISPGPSTPLNAGISNQVILAMGSRIPILGVCLGHQCIGHVYGGRVVRAREVRHGKPSQVYHRREGIFANLPSPFSAIRYHSLAVAADGLPTCLKITAWCEDGTIMGIEHVTYPVSGVQFHPESFMTCHGLELIGNFLNQGVKKDDKGSIAPARRTPVS
ncbi:MAG: aminodeoxychorismate/anthranilate synthase component II [Dehalococcoidaceae bacterium]|nr:aminodeoxychorismate/anthranilate synthase component II [Dehalococcoidaceae bacterium]